MSHERPVSMWSSRFRRTKEKTDFGSEVFHRVPFGRGMASACNPLTIIDQAARSWLRKHEHGLIRRDGVDPERAPGLDA